MSGLDLRNFQPRDPGLACCGHDGNGQGACFSADRVYRYALWRRWDHSKASLAFVMLNPSTADESELDPTLRRCVGYALDLGYGGVEVANLFPFVATDPKDLWRAKNPYGHELLAEMHILSLAGRCDVVLGFGVPSHRGMGWGAMRWLRTLLDGAGVQPLALATTKGGFPAHPLYLRREFKPEPYFWPAFMERANEVAR